MSLIRDNVTKIGTSKGPTGMTDVLLVIANLKRWKGFGDPELLLAVLISRSL